MLQKRRVPKLQASQHDGDDQDPETPLAGGRRATEGEGLRPRATRIQKIP